MENDGLWEDPRKRARGPDGSPLDVRALAQFDVAPHWSVLGGESQTRRAERARQEGMLGLRGHAPNMVLEVGSSSQATEAGNREERTDDPHREIEGDRLEEMVADLLAREEDQMCEDDCPCEEEAERIEDILLNGARSPLYEGASYSVLRSVLEILNLQAVFGWSNASVDALLK